MAIDVPGPSKSRSTIQVSGTWDIETEDWSTFVTGALHIPGQETRAWSWRKEEDFVSTLISLEGIYWAHNGGRFDSLWLLGHLAKRGISARVSLAGSDAIAVMVGKATFRDSRASCP
jgi:hypothetical protein